MKQEVLLGMNKRYAVGLIGGCIAAVTLMMPAATAQQAPSEPSMPESTEVGEPYVSSATVLDNGMEVVLIENHANPMIACFLVVRSGQRDETEDVAGVGHFLEHAIFDGTEHRSKKQLYEDFDVLGSYVNASTKREYTEFFILSPKETFNGSLELLRDMIFHSTFPPDTLEQERGIVLEELRRDFDQPTEQADDLFYRTMYKDTPYARPILGSEAGLARLPRERLVEFYRLHYVPNNMVCVVIGDFQSPAMTTVIDSTFGEYARGQIPPKVALDLSSLISSSVNHVTEYDGKVDKCYLRVGIEIPNVWSEDYYPARLAAEMLNPYFQMHLNETPDSSISDISVEYFEDRDFATLNFYVDVPRRSLVDTAVMGLFQMLSALHDWITDERVAAAIQAHRSQDILQGQRLHMYGMMNSQIFARGGYPMWKFQYEHWGRVTANEEMAVADEYLSYPQYVATCLVPYSEASQPQTTSQQAKTTVRGKLVNGMVVVVRQDRDAPIFAAHLLVKGRAFREGPTRAGYADVLHRVLGQALVVDGKPLDDALQKIGAELETTDNPNIPYDDYRTSPEYSYLRMECLDEYRTEALNLLGGIVTQSPIDSVTVSRAKTELVGVLSSKQTSASWRANQLFLSTMLGADHPLAQSEFGSRATVGAVTARKIASYYRSYFAGTNVILTVITASSPRQILEQARATFASLPAIKLPDLKYAPPPDVGGRVEEAFGKKQSAVRLGTVLRYVDPADRAALEVWNGIVSDRLAFVIREERGWAYSIGSSLWFVDNWALWRAGWGTGPENVDTSIAVARGILAQCLTEVPDSLQVRRIVNQLLRDEGMRRMTRINQAMVMGLAELDGVDRSWDLWSQAIQRVTGQELVRIAGKYLDVNKVVEVVVR